jgi:hypothetical protein
MTVSFQELSQLLQRLRDPRWTLVAAFAADTRLGIVMPPRTNALRVNSRELRRHGQIYTLRAGRAGLTPIQVALAELR